MLAPRIMPWTRAGDGTIGGLAVPLRWPDNARAVIGVGDPVGGPK
jgi:hypothetical protein